MHTRDWVQPLPRPVVLPARLSIAAMALSGISRASAGTKSTVSASAPSDAGLCGSCAPESRVVAARPSDHQGERVSSTRTTISSIRCGRSVCGLPLVSRQGSSMRFRGRDRASSVLALGRGDSFAGDSSVHPAPPPARGRQLVARSMRLQLGGDQTLSGSTASYWRRAWAASKRACSSANSTCRHLSRSAAAASCAAIAASMPSG